MRKLLATILAGIAMCAMFSLAACGTTSSDPDSSKSICLSFVAAGQEVDSVTTDNDKEVTLPTAPEKTGYSFVSWLISGTETVFTADYLTQNTVEENLTLVATYAANTYQLSFEDGETDVAAITVTYDSALSNLPAVPERLGHAGVWKIDGQEISKTDIWNFTENKTAKAVYTAKDVLYSVKVYAKDDIDGEYTDVTTNYLDYVGDLSGKTGETADITEIVAEMKPEKYDLAQTSVLTGTILADGSLELSVYFDVKVLTVSYYIADDLYTTESVAYGKNAQGALPEKANGIEYIGWIGTDMKVAALTEITANTSVYAWYKIVAAVGDEVEVKLPSAFSGIELRSADSDIVDYDQDSGKFVMKKLGSSSIGMYMPEGTEALASIAVEIKTASIKTAAEFMAIQDTLDQDYTYILANDIDLTVDSEGYTVTTKFSWGAGEHHDAAATKEFKGHIKGNGHTVKMTISEGIYHPSDTRYVFDMALIHKMSGGSIEDICFDIDFTNADADQTALVMNNFGTVKNVLYKAKYAGLSDWGTCHNAMVWNNYGYVENCVAIHDVGSLTKNNVDGKSVNVVGAQQGLLGDLDSNGWAGMSNCVNIVVNSDSYQGGYDYVGANDFDTSNNAKYTQAEFISSDFAFDSAKGWSSNWQQKNSGLFFGTSKALDYVYFTQSAISVAVNDTASIPVAGKIDGATYSVENEAIAVIEGGKVKGVAIGETTLTVTVGEDTYTIPVKVNVIKISTAAEFMAIQDTLDQDYTYVLANDIDLTVDSEGYTVTTKFSWGAGEHHDAPAAKEFKGHIKGNGHTVKMTISEGIYHPSDTRYVFDMALIHKMSGGSIEDICFDIDFTNADADQTALVMNNFGTVKNVLYKAKYAGLSDWGTCHNAMVWNNYGYVENCVAIHDVGSLTKNNVSGKSVNVVGAQQGLLGDLDSNGWAGMSNCVNIVVNSDSYQGGYDCVGANGDYGTSNNAKYTQAEFVASDFAFDSANGWNGNWSKTETGVVLNVHD